MFAGQKAREVGLLDKGALPPALWICALMTWLYCGAFYEQLYIVGNTYQRGTIDVIGGICGAAVNQAKWARFRAAARRHATPRKERASVILHVPRRARCCTVECVLRLVRYARNGSLARHDGGSCRGLERVDGGVACAAEASTEMVLCGGEGHKKCNTLTTPWSS